jgi:hypothetical protein
VSATAATTGRRPAAPVADLAHREQLELELERIRLLLRRRVLWLRAHWAADPLAGHGGLVVSDEQADLLTRGSDPEAERAFAHEHPPAAAITAELQGLEDELTARRAASASDGSPSPLDGLTESLGLTAFERDVLLLCLAPELDPGFERLFAYVHDDATRPLATPSLALDLLGHERAKAMRRLHSRAPLRRLRLVELVADERSGWAGRSLRLDERVLEHLLGRGTVDERVRGLLRSVVAPPLCESEAVTAAGLATELAERLRGGTWTALGLSGSPHAAKRGVALATCGQLGLRLTLLDCRAASRLDIREVGVLLAREAALLGLAFMIELQGAEPDDSHAIGLIESLEATVVVSSREPRRLERDLVSVELPPPDAAERRKLWRAALGDGRGDVDALAQQFEIGAEAIAEARVAAGAKARLRTGDPSTPPDEPDLWAACRERARPRVGELARRVVPAATWEDIVLPPTTLAQLEEIAAQACNGRRVYEAWGFGARLTRGRGISALFSGRSGTGKTMAAEVLAGRLELDLFRVDLAGLVSKYIGETEKNLRKVFDTAEDSGSILFFDEADALFGKRTSTVKDSHDRYANFEVDYLLQRMEDYRGVAILATNRKGLIDPAFLRRLRFLLDFPLPDAAARRRMWQRTFPPEAELGQLDFDALARLEVSGGSIRTIALNAAFLAASESSAIEMGHLRHAAHREYAKLDKLITEAEFGEAVER